MDQPDATLYRNRPCHLEGPIERSLQYRKNAVSADLTLSRLLGIGEIDLASLDAAALLGYQRQRT
jgi:hypothetical protein